MQEVTKFYPVLIPTLNRYEHFKRCVESLSRNTHADKTELVIGLDYPPSDKYVEGNLKIKKYISNIRGFAKVTIIEHKTNVGAGGNLRCLREYVYNHYDACISTEDDNEFSPCFLDFMNKALSYYYNNSKVMSVCGYTAKSYEHSDSSSILYTHDSCAWGIGLWKHKEQNVTDISYYQKIWNSSISFWTLFCKAPKITTMFAEMMSKQTQWGDVMRSVKNMQEKTYQVKPYKSLVRNWGYDGSGLHCHVINHDMEKQEIIESTNFNLNFNNTIVNSLPFIVEFNHLLPSTFTSKIHMIIWCIYQCIKFRIKYN